MKKLLFGFSILILLTGCIPSFYSLYTDNDLVLEPKLNGSWAGEKKSELWTFQLNTVSQIYKVTYTDDSSTAVFQGGLVKLGGELFMDTYPDRKNDLNPLLEMHLVPMHYIFRIRLSGDQLWLVPMNDGSLEKMLKNKKNKLKYETDDDQFILTTPTKELQAFIAKNAANPELFDENAKPLTRK